MTERKLIEIESEEVDIADLFDQQSVSDVIEKLKKLEDSWLDRADKEGYFVKFGTGRCGYDLGLILELQVCREETDEEYHSRLEKTEKVRKAKEAKERAQYERLKKKFEMESEK
jgi:hypothetical protein